MAPSMSTARPKKPAVILLSGGLDSATVLAVAQNQGFDPYAISFRYGQRHAVELAAAKAIVTARSVREHRVVDIDLRQFGGSALTSEIAVPKHDRVDEFAGDIPVTYVPARNTIFLSFALGWAEVIGAADIFIGVNALDFSGYPDCRPEFIAAFEVVANLATKAGVVGSEKLKIHAPLIQMTKAQIIKQGLELGVDYALTTSCYDPAPGPIACGRCDSCLLRKKGFAENGVTDPIAYA